MATIRMVGSCMYLTSAMTAIAGTILKTSTIIAVKENGVGPDCPDFKAVKSTLEPGQFPTPALLCVHCHRSFFGHGCYSTHKVSSSSKYRSLCDFKKKCLQCRKVYETSLTKAKRGGDRVKFKHKCGSGECPFCEKQVECATHQCFIQAIDPKDDKPKLHKVHASQVGS